VNRNRLPHNLLGQRARFASGRPGLISHPRPRRYRAIIRLLVNSISLKRFRKLRFILIMLVASSLVSCTTVWRKPNSVSDVVGYWQFPERSVWILIMEDQRAFQCRIGDGRVYSGIGEYRSPGLLVWARKTWGIDNVYASNTGLRLQGPNGVFDYIPITHPMGTECQRRFDMLFGGLIFDAL